MMSWEPLVALLALVAGVTAAPRWAPAARLLRWLPAPLWCYVLPMLAVGAGWLPAQDPWYARLTSSLLPFALALLLLGVHLPSVWTAGGPALAAMALGALSIIAGVPLIAAGCRAWLPDEAWTGVGALAGTWTGGSMNLLALRTVLDVPESIFTALILVDAVVAYGWMAVLVAASPHEPALNRWLRAEAAMPAAPRLPTAAAKAGSGAIAAGVIVSAALAAASGRLAQLLPATRLVPSAGGWTILLVTTLALAASCWGALRRLGEAAAPLGTFGLYLVLAAMGSQAQPEALWAAPAWLLVGLGVVLLHGAVMLLGGRLLRLPLGILATASQANFGGVVSAPLVAAVYHPRLMPLGLCLAIAGNAFGTYAGLLAAGFARWLTQF